MPIEKVNYECIIKPVLLNSSLFLRETETVIAVAARGYSFPTKLDTDPPVGSRVPKTQQQLLAEALNGKWRPEKLGQVLDIQTTKRRA